MSDKPDPRRVALLLSMLGAGLSSTPARAGEVPPPFVLDAPIAAAERAARKALADALGVDEGADVGVVARFLIAEPVPLALPTAPPVSKVANSVEHAQLMALADAMGGSPGPPDRPGDHEVQIAIGTPPHDPAHPGEDDEALSLDDGNTDPDDPAAEPAPRAARGLAPLSTTEPQLALAPPRAADEAAAPVMPVDLELPVDDHGMDSLGLAEGDPKVAIGSSHAERIAVELMAVLGVELPLQPAAPAAPTTPADERDAAPDAAPIVMPHGERVLASLDEVLAQPRAAAIEQRAAHLDIELPLPAIEPVAPLPKAFGDTDAEALQRLAEANAAIVASHAERAMLSLQATLDPPAHGARPEPTIVASHVDKVLLELAALSEPPRKPRQFGARAAVAGNRLDDVRGGFQTSGGLNISFGIERAVYIDGTLVATTSLNVAGGRLAIGQLPPSDLAALNGLALVQSGPGNTFSGSVSPSALGTVVQNTLNDRNIQSVTVINATVNSMQMMRELNLQSALRGALTDALRR